MSTDVGSTGAQRLDDAWSAFVSDHLEPLLGPLGAAAAVALVLVVVARAVTPVTLSWPRLTVLERSGAGTAGAVAVLLAAAVLTVGQVVPRASALPLVGAGAVVAMLAVAATAVGLSVSVRARVSTATARPGAPRGAPEPGSGWSWWAGTAGVTTVVALVTTLPGSTEETVASGSMILYGACLAALGVVLVGTYVATGLRIAVVPVGGTSSEVSTGRMLSFLRELAGEPPRGLEVPRGADVDVLAGGALSSLPDNPVLRTIAAAVSAALGSTPWRVFVEDAPADETTKVTASVTVTVTRNGRTAASAVIDRGALLASAAHRAEVAPRTGDATSTLAAADLHQAAAAVVVVTLARFHVGFDGLCGTTSWRALALHYLATTAAREDDDAQRALLGRALDEDPGSWLVQLAYRHALERHSTDFTALHNYRRWLTLLLDGDTESRYGRDADGAEHTLRQGGAFETMRLRTLYTRSCLAINEHFARGRGIEDFSPGSVRDVVALVVELNTRHAPGSATGPDAARLAQGLRRAALPNRDLVAEAVRHSDAVRSARRVLDDGSSARRSVRSQQAAVDEAVRAFRTLDRAIATTEADAAELRALLGSARHRTWVTSSWEAELRAGVVAGEAAARLAVAGWVRCTARVDRSVELLAAELDGAGASGGHVDRTVLEEAARELGALREITHALRLVVPLLEIDDAHELGPTAHYNRACFHASCTTPDLTLATEHLRLATAVPEHLAWSRDDPQLRRYREGGEYRLAFGRRPLETLLGLDVLTTARTLLERAGLVDEDLVPDDAQDLADQTGLTAPVAARAAAVARAVRAVPAALRPVRYDVVQTLRTAGCTDVSAQRPPRGGEDLLDALTGLLRALDVPTADAAAYAEALSSWTRLPVPAPDAS
ncbi:hypothetical protein IF650_10110 [Cellulosimicrobium terreum]|nr:hypothetical protein [Cellulosimicrobium terreum]